ncbi:hypothetical protein GGI25_005572 [Coemansia spiralis]|uniref:Uncharacterized protein n=2 Tax=Coemansia TaxID=4863 RepID=A0A9W8KW45_9FUNG|nr:hypothetical protein BX070DRAFT_238117 [Coemansia spiralis]KAJ1987810.1 hypothetical protein EDC05_005643 [Coemansia umbellata]KAJ2619453.1 hypothetical protein GGI26_005818 [Coemansia sp. RSA 1358]KAJ2671207.1 hypothetical protein GGI25_005572 [Coemansia spiralis]
MKFFAALVVAATAVLAQQQEGNQGPNISEGPSAVSNPNVNNGFQAQGSFLDSSSSGGNKISGEVGGSFNHEASNSAILDSNFINPSQSSVSGNKGNTANGEGNHIGDLFEGLGGFGLHRRDAVFNNFGHGYDHARYVPAYAPHPEVAYARPPPPHPVVYARPVPVQPVAYVPVRHEAYAPAPHPAVYPVGYPAGQFNHNVQQASIVQNQA